MDTDRAHGDLKPIYAYAHVPHAYTGDAREAIITQIERFAPGFRDRIAATKVCTPADFERDNPNNVGGDINAAPWTSERSSPDHASAQTPTGWGPKATTCARHQHHQEEASTACVDTLPPAALSNTRNIHLRSRKSGWIRSCLDVSRPQFQPIRSHGPLRRLCRLSTSHQQLRSGVME